ncbi:FAD/NAD(P)-binding protein [Frankia sp. QA3]|uniref:FAD/NAD(P)-binding protein n=1 Tax=Frankia sp. QA3 TaxID=710111 RepID=UPI000269BD6D|nr:FAD/NAD(P)-binding protein [Frankia sp. QA3]EIV93025.1 hypothetical protein FraQA3DRAFT_2700 [Frankia sp. QA3]
MVTVAVIGCGPRGLTVVERFVSLVGSEPVTLHVIEPGPLGVGIHGVDLPPYLLLNTVCAELTAFVDDAMVDGGGVTGPTLYEWARRHEPKFTDHLGRRREVRPADHLPRAILGRYLAWAAGRILAAARPNLRVVHHAERAVAIAAGRGAERVILASGTELRADQVVMTVGHDGTAAPPSPDRRAPAGRWIARPYPLPAAVADVPPGAVVGMLGTGLSAMDALAAVTVGRGGRFEDRTDGLCYVPSGAEPRVILLSRDGLPARARPAPRVDTTRPGARFFTTDAVTDLRSRRPGGQLDFVVDVLPLVIQEMAHRHGGDLAAATAQITEMVTATVPRPALTDIHQYRAWYRAELAADLGQADAGLDNSPLKHAMELLRDHRDVLRAVIDPPGVTDGSLDWFFGPFAATVNRCVIGPQRERHAELLALLDTGVTVVGPGPKPALAWDDGAWSITATRLAEPVCLRADYLMAAYVPNPGIAGTANSVVRRLAADRRLRSTRIGTGAVLTRDGRPVNPDGKTDERLFVLGPLAEGTSYYNHFVASPGAHSRSIADADRVVRHALESGDRRTTAPG